MPDEKKSRHPETNFLPPLNMMLTFFDSTFCKREEQKDTTDGQKAMNEKNVGKLIEKLSEKEK